MEDFYVLLIIAGGKLANFGTFSGTFHVWCVDKEMEEFKEVSAGIESATIRFPSTYLDHPATSVLMQVPVITKVGTILPPAFLAESANFSSIKIPAKAKAGQPARARTCKTSSLCSYYFYVK